MSVSPDDVRQVAALARLALDEAHVTSLVADLNTILGHMAVLQAVQLDVAREDDAPSMPSTLRADTPGAVTLATPRMAFAPSAREGFFLVPRLDTHE